MKFAFAVLLLAAVPAIAQPPVTRARLLMATVCEITASDAVAIDAAFAEASRVEAMISTWRDDSELARVNAGAVRQPSAELHALIASAMQIAKETDGAFNPLVRPLIEAWDTRGAGRVPDHAALAAAVARTSMDNIALAGDTIALRNGAAIEEGAFGKGYALDRMLAKLAGDTVINFGGQLLVRGTHVVTIADPAHRDRPLFTRTIATRRCSRRAPIRSAATAAAGMSKAATTSRRCSSAIRGRSRPTPATNASTRSAASPPARSAIPKTIAASGRSALRSSRSRRRSSKSIGRMSTTRRAPEPIA
jgi:hypothetical protein